MKTPTIPGKLYVVVLMLLLSTTFSNAQTTGVPGSAPNINQSAVPAPTPCAVISRDAHSAIWEQTTFELSPSGQVVPSQHGYTELATGLNFKDPKTGQWQPSREEIDILPDGTAVANHGQHSVIFPGDIAQGVITLNTADGLKLQSSPIALSYDDGNKTVLIAVLKESTGYLAGSNEVVYSDAFDGVAGSIRYQYTKAGFEQNIVLEACPPAPESFGLNSENTRLQVITEFYNPPQPTVTSRNLPTQTGVTLADEQLNFGAMQMIPGKAFLLGTNSSTVPVAKRWLNVDGRQLLVEEVPVVSIAGELLQLPAPQAVSAKARSPLRVLSAKRLLPPQRLVKTSPNNQPGMRVAKAALPAHGLVLDYVTVSSQTGFTFQGDGTYFISGAVYLNGTNNFEGGSVLKYASNASLTLEPSLLPSRLNWQASAYRPVVFTAMDDNSVGETITGSTGNPTNYYANPALQTLACYCAPISYFRIAYAKQAVILEDNYNPNYIRNGQIINCQGGFGLYGVSPYLRNVLFSSVATAFDLGFVNSLDVQNSTFDSVSYLTTIDGGYQTVQGYFTNCIFSNVANLTNDAQYPYLNYGISGGYNGFYNSPNFGSSTVTNSFPPFQTVGAGNYYLTNGCDFFNQGTTNIDPTLLADLATKTTYPPTVWTNMISINTIWPPQVYRDNWVSSGVLDLGYHYDPLDYLLKGLTISNKISLTLSNGVAVGLSSQYGFTLKPNSCFVSQGTATLMNHIVWYPAVQEQSVKLGNQSVSGSTVFNPTDPMTNLCIQATFTDFAMQGLRQRFNYYDLYSVSITNCWLRGVYLCDGPSTANWFQSFPSWRPVITIKNNLIERSTVSLYYGTYWVQTQGGTMPYGNPLAVTMYNNLFWQSSLDLNYFDGMWYWWGYHLAWTITDNLFDTATLTLSGDGNYTSYISATNNAFYQTVNIFWGTNNLILTNLSYATGPFGPWYIAASSTSLVDMGSRTADVAGLYHYTMFTNLVDGLEVPEADSIVDIGYHYVATDRYGNPLDTDSDGIPDYLEDANGNGLLDQGETDWQNAADLGLKVLITRPKNNSIIP